MTTEEREPRATPAGGLFGPRLAATALLVLAAVLIMSAFGIAAGGGYSVIGPATIPLVVAIVLLALAAIFALRTTILPDTDLAASAADEERATHWPTIGLVAITLIGYALALDGFSMGPLVVPGLGYVVATGIFLPLASRILGSGSPIRDVTVGFTIAIVVYIGFTQFLGVRLPAGLLGLLL